MNGRSVIFHNTSFLAWETGAGEKHPASAQYVYGLRR